MWNRPASELASQCQEMRTSRTRSWKKIDKYQSLKIELKQLWKVKIMVIPVVFGAIADRLPGWLAQTLKTISEVELQAEERPSRNDASPPACS